MRSFSCTTGLLISVVLFVVSTAMADGPVPVLIDLWPGNAPGETTASAGELLPKRPNENPPASRLSKITRPQLDVHLPDPAKSTGTAILIFPGGGHNYCVIDKEGSEVARWLNELGIAAFVVRYRTKIAGSEHPAWQRPLQDGQRAVSLVRSRVKDWNLQPDGIGVMGFSAGGQVAATVSSRFSERAYEGVDDVDQQSCRPDFTMLIYPAWLVEEGTVRLADFLPVSKDLPPAFLVHAHDDSITSLSSVAYYTAIKQQGISGELHIYHSGGHGYGIRTVEGTDVHTWPRRAEDWLRRTGR